STAAQSPPWSRSSAHPSARGSSRSPSLPWSPDPAPPYADAPPDPAAYRSRAAQALRSHWGRRRSLPYRWAPRRTRLDRHTPADYSAHSCRGSSSARTAGLAPPDRASRTAHPWSLPPSVSIRNTNGTNRCSHRHQLLCERIDHHTLLEGKHLAEETHA